MAINNSAANTANIVRIEGKAHVRTAQGELIALKAGDHVEQGQQITVDPQGHLFLQLANGQVLDLGGGRTISATEELLSQGTIDRSEAAIQPGTSTEIQNVIAALDAGQDPLGNLEAPGAGLNAGGSTDGGHGFVRLLRIVEDVTPQEYGFSGAISQQDLQVPVGTTQDVQTTPATPSIEIATHLAGGDDLINAIESKQPLTINGTTSNVEDGQKVTVVLNGVSHTATVTGSTWSLDIPAEEVANLTNGTHYTITANVSSQAGTPATEASHQIAVDTTTPSIAIADMNGAAPGQITASEAGLATGSQHDGSNSATGTILVSAPKGLESIDFGTTHVTLAQLNAASNTSPVTVATADGSLAITGFNAATGIISYTYTITAPQTAAGPSSTDSISVVVHDNSGLSSTPTNLVASITNDSPTASNDSISTTVGHAVSGSLASNDTVGADAADSWALGTSAPAHGNVSINATTGAYTYTPNAGYLGSDSFTYTLRDADGDISTATASITIASNGNPGITIVDMNGAAPGHVTVDEAALPTGSNPASATEAATGTLNISTPNGLASIDFGTTMSLWPSSIPPATPVRSM